MVSKEKMTIRSQKVYSWLELCEMFGRPNKKHTMMYYRYRRGLNLVLGAGSHRQSRSTKYFISGADLYRFVRQRRPEFIKLLRFVDE